MWFPRMSVSSDCHGFLTGFLQSPSSQFAPCPLDVSLAVCCIPPVSLHTSTKLREWDLNPRLPAYEADLLPLHHPAMHCDNAHSRAAYIVHTKQWFTLSSNFPPCHGHRIGHSVYTLTRPPFEAENGTGFSLRLFPCLIGLSLVAVIQ